MAQAGAGARGRAAWSGQGTRQGSPGRGFAAVSTSSGGGGAQRLRRWNQRGNRGNRRGAHRGAQGWLGDGLGAAEAADRRRRRWYPRKKKASIPSMQGLPVPIGGCSRRSGRRRSSRTRWLGAGSLVGAWMSEAMAMQVRPRVAGTKAAQGRGKGELGFVNASRGIL